MTTKIYYEDDAKLDLIQGLKIAIIGFGAQGKAHSLNLRDSGCQVLIGQRAGPGFDSAVENGFQPVSIEQAAEEADIVNLMMPDEVHGQVFEKQIQPHLKPGNIVMACHGFSFHYGYVKPAEGVDQLLVAPKGQGHTVRGEFLRGGGVPCLVATNDGAADRTLQIGLSYAKALGGTKAGVIHTTIAAETETDLFGEQAVLCGGLTELVKAGFDTLVDAGYQPELAYFECLHELKIIIDLLYRSGISNMRDAISTTAEYGDYVSGPKVIDSHVRDNMKKVLTEIQNGNFAKQFMDQHHDQDSHLKSLRQQNAALPIENVGAGLRKMMPWLESES